MDDIESLVFFRNKMTTSRRTHKIHQLSCVGGTAGCKLFTPDVSTRSTFDSSYLWTWLTSGSNQLVECKRTTRDRESFNKNWTCTAEISDRVILNHTEVICEGYDYAEDDYILRGSCGLEFTLDYASPLDHHENSYFQHMDDHEKEQHIKRVKAELEKKSDL